MWRPFVNCLDLEWRVDSLSVYLVVKHIWRWYLFLNIWYFWCYKKNKDNRKKRSPVVVQSKSFSPPLESSLWKISTSNVTSSSPSWNLILSSPSHNKYELFLFSVLISNLTSLFCEAIPLHMPYDWFNVSEVGLFLWKGARETNWIMSLRNIFLLAIYLDKNVHRSSTCFVSIFTWTHKILALMSFIKLYLDNQDSAGERDSIFPEIDSRKRIK